LRSLLVRKRVSCALRPRQRQTGQRGGGKHRDLSFYGAVLVRFWLTTEEQEDRGGEKCLCVYRAMSGQSSRDPLSNDSLDSVNAAEENVAEDRCVVRLSKFGLPTGLARPIQAWKLRVAEVCACLVQDMEDELIELYEEEGRLRIPPGEGLRFVLCEELLEAVDTISGEEHCLRPQP